MSWPRFALIDTLLHPSLYTGSHRSIHRGYLLDDTGFPNLHLPGSKFLTSFIIQSIEMAIEFDKHKCLSAVFEAAEVIPQLISFDLNNENNYRSAAIERLRTINGILYYLGKCLEYHSHKCFQFLLDVWLLHVCENLETTGVFQVGFALFFALLSCEWCTECACV